MNTLHQNSVLKGAAFLLFLTLLVTVSSSLTATATEADPVRSITSDSDTTTEQSPATIPTIAAFGYEINSRCEVATVDFLDSSIGADSWRWDFGDGSTSTDQNPTHNYAASGTYDVTLTVTNICGSDDTTRSIEIILVEPPIADFDYDLTEICQNGVVTFSDLSTDADSWLWDFGDGSTSTDQNPTHTYTAMGTYDVNLTVTNDCGDDDTTRTIEITVLGPPIADFDVSGQIACIALPVTFTDQSSFAQNWFWDFGDGTTSTDVNPTHVYSSVGTYTVFLRVTNDCGTDTETRVNYISIHPTPEAQFTADQTEGCVGMLVSFTDQSNEVDRWDWDFGDGATSGDSDPVHRYTVAGTYTVSLMVSNSCGNDTEIKTAYVVVHPEPIADYTSDKREACVYDDIQFTDLSQYATTWEWDFGDGTTSQDRNPVHSYSSPGNYDVTLTVTNDCGGDSEFRGEYITISEGPTAGFVADQTDICEGATVVFTNQSQGATSWQWHFGDGGSSQFENPSHTYNTPGTYSVQMRAYNDCGDELAVRDQYINVHPDPTAEFEAMNPWNCLNTPVSFIDLSSEATSWFWEFGDGSTSTNQNPSHTYPGPGRYTVTLTVANDCGEDSETKNEYVYIGQGPIADFTTYNSEGCVGWPIDFEDMSIDADDWFWEFGDGGTSTEQNPSHTYRTDGRFTVTLTVTNECGTDVEERINYILIHPYPTAEFTADQTDLCVGDIVSFTDLSNEAYDWDWNFGDGGTSDEQNPTHEYNVAGTYTVSLTVNNGCGDNTETKTAYIVVHPDPIADYTSNTREACVYDDVQFTDLSQYATTWEWDFGDGNTSRDRHPTHNYSAPGKYDVTLTVTNDCYGDSEYRGEYITILEEPTAGFTADQTDICEGATVQFTNSSTDATSWTWDFGDGGNSQAENPSHTYNTPGTYMVQMVAYNSCGDDVAIRDNYITVRPKPIPDFSIHEGPWCTTRPVGFSNLSEYADSYLWDFGDGTNSAEEHPTHTYATAGTYTVSLSATNDCGTVKTTYSNAVYIESGPTPDFTADNPNSCVGEVVIFTSHSTNAHFIDWDFGDGNTDYGSVTSHAYQAPGVYTVKMWATNDCGIDSLVREAYITVGEYPLAGFMADKYEVCVGGTINFTDQSIRAESWLWDFGDGNTSPAQHPSHSYVKAGIYRVYLTVSNDCGSNTGPEPLTIIVKPVPTADFTYQTSGDCGPITVTFTNQSNVGDSWLWDFGDGTTSIEEDPIHSYAVQGTYDVKLTVTNDCGTDDITKQVPIEFQPPPVADFTSNTTRTCVGSSIQFTDQSTDALDWDWDFGDGLKSKDRNPSHTYTTAGTYTVTLEIVGACGTDYETKEEYITVDPGPIANFSADPTEGCADLTVAFTDQSVDAESWSWSFGDGQTSNTQNPTHTYSSAGTYTVRLTVSNECGTDDEVKEAYITVLDGPTADFTYQQDPGCDYGIVHFTDLSIGATSWHWDFGDGGTSNQQNPDHTYDSDGDYTVTLTASNDCDEDIVSKTVTIELTLGPIADFAVEVDEVCIGETVWFINQSTRADTYEWNFGDGTTSYDEHPSHIYTIGGVYAVSLKVTNNCGEATKTKINFVTVHSGPTADFSATPRTGTPTLSVAFTDLSTSSQGITSWTWTFGDGGTSSIQNPTHDYTAPGTYTVSLTVVDPCGPDNETKTEYIYVVDTCSIDFIAEPTDGCAPLTVWFGGVPTGNCNITSWLWDFGDPASGNENSASTKDAEHIYTQAGTYTVTLKAFDGEDILVVTKTDIVTVNGGPTASFVATPTSGTAPLLVNFTDQSSSPNGVTAWEWNFGDPASGLSNTSSDQDPTHVFANDGVYLITLIASDYCGSDTTTETITVKAALEISKAVNKPMAVAGEELLYTLTLRNTSSESLTGILIADTIPDMSTYVTGSISGSGTYVPTANMVMWTIPVLGARSELTFTFNVDLNGPFQTLPATVSNYATATIGTEFTAKLAVQTYVSNIVETIVDIPLGPPSIDKDVNTALANPGDTLTYTITITNGEPAPVFGVKVYDAPPENTAFLGNITGGGTYDPLTDSLYWDIGTLAMLSDTAVSFQVTVDNDVLSGTRIPNSALFVTDFQGGDQSDTVLTVIHIEPIVITKTVNRPSGMIGDLIKFTIKIRNFSDQLFTDLTVLDTMPPGITYVNGTSLLEGTAVADPSGTNPITWTLGDLQAGSTVTLEYTSLISPSASPGLHDNIARAVATQSGILTQTNRAVAQIYVLSYTISGSIRGKVIVDCDGDGIADMDNVPSGMDIYLDDGSHSRVNDSGMFYFSTVRPGERVVALDERDMKDFFIPEDAQVSVFVHVHEAGESYVLFRICPDYPRLDILKEASIIPTVKVTKSAKINPEPVTDSLGVLIDYQIDIKSNGLADSTSIKVIDSIPDNMNIILPETGELIPQQSEKQLVYEITATETQLQKSISYSLKDNTPGTRPYITNRVHLEGYPTQSSAMTVPIVSQPAEVAAGPFLLAPPEDVMITLTPALFITSKAFLQPPAFPLLRVVADSIRKYPDAQVKVEGHTDLRIINTVEFPSNWELGEARAKAVVDWLVDSANIDGDRMTYESFAATRPVVIDAPITSVALQPNRRTEVILKAGVRGFLAPAASPADGWQNSTSMALDPNRFVALFEIIENPVATDLTDSWEVVLTVINESNIGADIISLTDLLPSGTRFVTGSASLDELAIEATVLENVITLPLGQIEPLQKLQLRYRIRVVDGQQPSGGGAASIEVKTASELPVVQSSNEVTFE